MSAWSVWSIWSDHMKKLPPLRCPCDILGQYEKPKKEVAAMYYTGIDLHKKTSFLTTVEDYEARA